MTGCLLMNVANKVSPLALPCLLLLTSPLFAEPVPVRHTEGLVHGFLVLRTIDGKTVAEGDQTEIADGENITARLVYHLKDGSVHDETTVFSQSHAFRLLKYHLVQKGPSFQHPQDMSIDTAQRQVTVRYTDDHGKERTTTDQMDLPPDVANGVILTILKNIHPNEPQTLSMVAATPKPRLVHLSISAAGEESFSIVDSKKKAVRYEVKVEIGGIAGWFAHLVGKVPPPTYVWILQGDAPAFVKSEGPLCMDCPIWRTELTSPVWPVASEHEDNSSTKK